MGMSELQELSDGIDAQPSKQHSSSDPQERHDYTSPLQRVDAMFESLSGEAGADLHAKSAVDSDFWRQLHRYVRVVYSQQINGTMNHGNANKNKEERIRYIQNALGQLLFDI